MTTSTAFWDKAAPKYAQSTISDLDGYRETLMRTRTHLSATDHVLELGCGTASTALELAPHVAHLTATDISGAMIDIGKEKAWNAGQPNITFKVADVSDPALLSDGPYDAVLALNLLHLLPEQAQALANIHALLKPGGLVISKTPCLGERWFFKPLIAGMRLFGKAPPIVSQKLPELRNAVLDAGFETVEELVQTGTPPRLYHVARKRA